MVKVIFNRQAPRRSNVNNVPHVKAERGKETMAFNNSDVLQSVVLEVLGQAIVDTTESSEDTLISSTCRGRDITRLTSPPLLHSVYLRLRSRGNFSSHSAPLEEHVQRKYSDLVVKIRLCHTINFGISFYPLLSVCVLRQHRKRYSKLGPSKWYNYPSAHTVTLKQSLRHVEKSM